ncbi:calponin homology domain-containing protein [Amylostereum chailletii]|nr:calponin homology domain-containing protein [Amylostereum chailletii]
MLEKEFWVNGETRKGSSPGRRGAVWRLPAPSSTSASPSASASCSSSDVHHPAPFLSSRTLINLHNIMGESRSELLTWLNDLLQLNYTKVEQCGTGAAYCQILDSIYGAHLFSPPLLPRRHIAHALHFVGDIPMTRVKMNAKHEYEFIANFKVMQNVFKAKRIDKPILIEKLVKCKMQDNLEFLQWIKRFWDQNYGGQAYDAAARRRGQPTDTPATIAPLAPSGGGARGTSVRSGGKTPVGGHRSGSAAAVQHEQVINLQAQLKEMSAHLEGLEKERDFYFAKLRDIEILAQQQIEVLEGEGKDDETLREIQKILYSTEDGFEVPEGGVAADEEETF